MEDGTCVVSLQLRKGAWAEEEDELLKKCIHKYGEGKWHLVPLRAGLRRCRKSCRLRWMNYLRPNIKRGMFMVDEVDLLIRLHKLLGNRWSLIAGRLPGRTANDIKNYWNTHLHKKFNDPDQATSTHRAILILQPKAIRPRPRTFSRNLPSLSGKIATIDDDSVETRDNLSKPSPPPPPPPPPLLPPPPPTPPATILQAAVGDHSIFQEGQSYWRTVLFDNAEQGQSDWIDLLEENNVDRVFWNILGDDKGVIL